MTVPPDSCPLICDRYTEKDKRVCVIHKKNAGVSSARNAGIDCAKGKYICFVDSDDSLPVNSIEKLVYSFEHDEADCVFGMCEIERSGRVKNVISHKKIIRFQDEPFELLDCLTKSGSYSPYAKLFDSEIIKKHNLRYDETLTCSEDALFIREYAKYCKNLSLIPEVVYSYNTSNANSLSKKGHTYYSDYYVKKMHSLENLLDVLPLNESQKQQFLTQRAVHGLRISIRHYLTHWKDKDVQEEYVKRSVQLLSPWLFTTVLTTEKETFKWWKRYERYLQCKQYSSFFHQVKRDFEREMRLMKLKKTIKGFLKIGGSITSIIYTIV